MPSGAIAVTQHLRCHRPWHGRDHVRPRCGASPPPSPKPGAPRGQGCTAVVPGLLCGLPLHSRRWRWRTLTLPGPEVAQAPRLCALALALVRRGALSVRHSSLAPGRGAAAGAYRWCTRAP